MAFVGTRKALLYSTAVPTTPPPASDFDVAKFDGTGTGTTGGRMERGAQVMGTNSKQLTLGLRWAAFATPGSSQTVFQAQSGKFLMDHLPTNIMRTQVANAAGTQILDVRPDMSATTFNGTLHTLLMSFDLALGFASGCHIYMNGVSIKPASAVAFTNDTMDLAHVTVWDFLCGSAGNGNYHADNAFFWAESGVFLDLSNSAVRDEFLYANMGATGDGPTGSQPDIFITGPAADYIGGTANKGSGGAWTLVGTVTDV